MGHQIGISATELPKERVRSSPNKTSGEKNCRAALCFPLQVQMVKPHPCPLVVGPSGCLFGSFFCFSMRCRNSLRVELSAGACAFTWHCARQAVWHPPPPRVLDSPCFPPQEVNLRQDLREDMQEELGKLGTIERIRIYAQGHQSDSAAGKNGGLPQTDRLTRESSPLDC